MRDLIDIYDPSIDDRDKRPDGDGYIMCPDCQGGGGGSTPDGFMECSRCGGHGGIKPTPTQGTGK